MSETTANQWIRTAPLPEAFLVVIQELRTPIVSMRNALACIQQVTSCQTYAAYHPILRAHIDILDAHVATLFEIRASFTPPVPQGNRSHPHADAIPHIQILIDALRNEQAQLQHAWHTAAVACYHELEPHLQPIFTMGQTNCRVCHTTIQSLLDDSLLQRLQHEYNLEC